MKMKRIVIFVLCGIVFIVLLFLFVFSRIDRVDPQNDETARFENMAYHDNIVDSTARLISAAMNNGIVFICEGVGHFHDSLFSDSDILEIDEQDLDPSADDAKKLSIDEVIAVCRAGLDRVESDVMVDSVMDTDDVSRLVDHFYYHCPEYFWLVNDWGCEFFENSTKVIFMSDTAPSDVVSEKAIFDDKTRSIMSEIKLYWSDIDKIKFIYDFILDTTVYGDGENAHNAYGCIADGCAVCDGYAKGFSVLATMAGIENGIVYGSDIFTNDSSLSHAWNYVKLDGAYYWIDATWGDYFEAKYGSDYRYAYFLKSDSEFLNEHILLENDLINEFVPKCE